jgi:hypothetical protein
MVITPILDTYPICSVCQAKLSCFHHGIIACWLPRLELRLRLLVPKLRLVLLRILYVLRRPELMLLRLLVAEVQLIRHVLLVLLLVLPEVLLVLLVLLLPEVLLYLRLSPHFESLNSDQVHHRIVRVA